MGEQDTLRRFIFDELGIRGELVRLGASWQAVLERHAYPDAVREQLGQALAAVVLLSATVKFDGALILQVQGEGPLHTLVAQATHRRTLRGLALWREGQPPAGTCLEEIYGAARLVLTLQNEGAEPYQGIVGLEGRNLAEAVEHYFTRSEQLPTRLWLAADGEYAAGLFLQALPGAHVDDEGWARVCLLAGTVREKELLLLSGEQLLYRLFNEEAVRLFDPEPVSFRCSCSRERIAAVLRSMGPEELEAGLKQEDGLEVGCEFCNRHYRFDAVDMQALLAAATLHAVPRTRH